MTTTTLTVLFRNPDSTPATGLTLADIDFTLIGVHKTAGTLDTVLSAQDATVEVGNGIYAIHNVTIDLATYDYSIFVNYAGATSLKDTRAWGEIALDTAQINAEVVDALNVDTYTQPGQDAHPATASLVDMVRRMYKTFRNKKTNDGSNTKVFDDAGTTVDHKQATSSSGGTVTKDEWVSGP